MRILQVCLLLGVTALGLQAQATLGSAGVGGTVRDSSGAAIPGREFRPHLFWAHAATDPTRVEAAILKACR